MDFIKLVANINHKTIRGLTEFGNDPVLNRVNMVELVTAVHPNLTGSLVTFQSKVKANWQIVLTELGVCFSINSGFADLLSPSYSGSQGLILGTKKEYLKCHYLNGLCYARYDSDPNMPIKYHVHSPLEVIHYASEPPVLVGTSEEVEVNYRLTETHSAPEIRYLTPDQRKCRFDDEPYTKNVPVYSSSICYIECKSKWALKTCGCKPFYYKFLSGKLCDIQGLLCLSHKFSTIYNTSTCKCPQPCNLMVYLRQVPRVTRWETGYFDQRIAFRCGLIPPTTKYHRKIMFGLQDLIVSLGGVLSLFLGMSFISLQETFYLCGSYFCSYMQQRRKKINEITVLRKSDRKGLR